MIFVGKIPKNGDKMFAFQPFKFSDKRRLSTHEKQFSHPKSWKIFAFEHFHFKIDQFYENTGNITATRLFEGGIFILLEILCAFTLCSRFLFLFFFFQKKV